MNLLVFIAARLLRLLLLHFDNVLVDVASRRELLHGEVFGSLDPAKTILLASAIRIRIVRTRAENRDLLTSDWQVHLKGCSISHSVDG